MQLLFAPYKQLFLDREAVRDAVRVAGQDPQRLSRAGGLIRSEARRSMRYTKQKSAPPGQPPRAHKEEPNLRSIVYFWSPLLNMLAVGSPPFPGTRSRPLNVPEVHEFGGTTYQPSRLKLVRPPRAKSGRRATRRQLAALKRKQQSPEARLLRSIAMRRQPVVMVRKTYPARPYMWPALLRIMDRLPSIWRHAIRRYHVRHSQLNPPTFGGASARSA